MPVKSDNSVNLKDLSPRMEDFIVGLEKKLGREVVITSGFRGELHPLEIDKKEPGEHTTGLAIDVACLTPKDFILTVGCAYELGSRRIGVSRKKHFVHIGLDRTRPESLWVY